MTPDRRTLLAAAAGLLAGCAGLESGSTPTDRTETDPPDATDGADPTSTPSGGSRLEDLRVDNAGDEPRTLTVRFVPESGEETTLEFSLLVSPDERIVWENNPLLDEAGRVTAIAEAGGGTVEGELDWQGDADDDSRGIVVRFDGAELTVESRVA
jgi:hypothetical protein